MGNTRSATISTTIIKRLPLKTSNNKIISFMVHPTNGANKVRCRTRTKNSTTGLKAEKQFSVDAACLFINIPQHHFESGAKRVNAGRFNTFVDPS